jgi:hypothetical protein
MLPMNCKHLALWPQTRITRRSYYLFQVSAMQPSVVSVVVLPMDCIACNANRSALANVPHRFTIAIPTRAQ